MDNTTTAKPLELHPIKEKPEGPGKTVSEIMQGAKRAVENGIPISPAQWLDAAQRLAVLIQDVDDSLIDAEMEYRELRSKFMQEGASGVQAETNAKATNSYRRLLGLKAERERIAWFVQIAKKRVDLQTFDQ